jgi:hypothetical protein
MWDWLLGARAHLPALAEEILTHRQRPGVFVALKPHRRLPVNVLDHVAILLVGDVRKLLRHYHCQHHRCDVRHDPAGAEGGHSVLDHEMSCAAVDCRALSFSIGECPLGYIRKILGLRHGGGGRGGGRGCDDP